MGEGREEVIGARFDMAIVDFGLVSLIAFVPGRAGFEGSSASAPEGLHAATVFERPRPNKPEFGLLLAPVAVAVGEGRLLPATAAPARVLVAIADAPSLGSLLGDVFRGSAGAEMEAAAPLLLGSSLFAATREPSFLSSSCLCTLPRPAVGWRRERDRFSPVDEDEDDMVLEGARSSIVTCCLRGDNLCLGS